MKIQTALPLFCSLSLSCLSFAATAQSHTNLKDNETNFYAGLVYLQTISDNLKYSVFVSGQQPLYQSWHYQVVEQKYSPGFELGFIYGFPETLVNTSASWLHLHTNHSAVKQASQSTDVATVQFVAPAYDVGPAVFGIKRAQSNVQFDFDTALFNVGRNFIVFPNVNVRLFTGANVLRINQYIMTTFSDYAGTPPTSLTYGLPPDPAFYFQTKNVSKYLGAGPDLGVNIQYLQFCGNNGFGMVGQFLGTITAGTMNVADNFTSESRQLNLLGIHPSRQEITAPATTQIVPGFDAKIGLLFNHVWPHTLDFSIEAGYRLAYYINAISSINPASLVQSGFSIVTPEFATGTMAINTTAASESPFKVSGLYLDLKLGFA